MAIILMILGWIFKIIGILLLSIVAILLVLVLLVLFVPIRYRLDFEKRIEIKYGGRVSWLFGILQFHYRKEEEATILEFRIFGICVKKVINENEPKSEIRGKSKEIEQDLWETNWQEIEEEEFKKKLFAYLSDDSTAKPVSNPVITVEEAMRKQKAVAIEEIQDTRKSESIDLQEKAIAQEQERADSKEEATTEKREKPQEPVIGSNQSEQSDDFFVEPEEEAEFLGDTGFATKKQKSSQQHKSAELKEKITRIWTIFQMTREYLNKNKGLFRHILYQLFRMVRSVLPKRLDGEINFGLNDPSHTGYVLAIFYLFYPTNRGKIDISPNFEEFIIEGRIQAKGRIIFALLLYYGIRIFLDMRIIRLVKLALEIKKKWKEDKEDTQASDSMKEDAKADF